MVSQPRSSAKVSVSARLATAPVAKIAPASAMPGRVGCFHSFSVAKAKAAASAAEHAYNQTRAKSPSRMPEPSFLALADMLAGEAAMCLGMVKNPAGTEMPIDLDTARHLIDMLGMLKEKTRGNLTAEENDVLENILAYLRMQFVALSRSQ